MTTLFYMGFNQSYVYKDISQIPIYFSKIDGNSSEIISYGNEDIFIKEDNCIYVNLYRGKIKQLGFLRCVSYVIKKAKETEVLNLYHWRILTFLIGLIYKAINPSGLLYVKLDNDFESINRNGTLFRNVKNGLHKLIINNVQEFFLKRVDIVSTETNKGFDLLNNNESFKKYKHKIHLVTNGFYHSSVLDNVLINNKQKIFTFSGRMGSYPKNSEFFIEVLKKLELKDWKINIIGSFENNFEDFFNKNVMNDRRLGNQVNVYNWIKEKEEYYNLLISSSVFCITSRTESFCIAAVEALACGNYIITTEIMASVDITNSGKLGTIIDQGNLNAYVEVMQSIIDGKLILKEKQKKCVEYANLKFNWNLICLDLYNKLVFIKNEK